VRERPFTILRVLIGVDRADTIGRGGSSVTNVNEAATAPEAPAVAERRPGRLAAARSAALSAAPAVLLYAALRASALLFFWHYAQRAHVSMWAALTRWDSAHYAGIVTRGYDGRGVHLHTNLAFFPLYPGLVALVDPVAPGGLVAAELIVSWAAGLAAAWGLFAVGGALRGPRLGVILAALFAVLPHAFVESMGYTETLFTALAAWSLVAVLRRQWVLAGVLCALAGLTRPIGVALAVAVGLAALVALVRRPGDWRAWLGGALAPAGFLGYVAWVGFRLGRADGYLQVQSAGWDMKYDGGSYTLTTLRKLMVGEHTLKVYVATAVLLLAVAMFVLLLGDRSTPWPLIVYAGFMLLVVLGGAGFYHVKARLLLPTFPLLLPAAYALAAAKTRTVVVVLAVAALISAWYGVYLGLTTPASP
jgi:hypothetical protein